MICGTIVVHGFYTLHASWRSSSSSVPWMSPFYYCCYSAPSLQRVSLGCKGCITMNDAIYVPIHCHITTSPYVREAIVAMFICTMDVTILLLLLLCSLSPARILMLQRLYYNEWCHICANTLPYYYFAICQGGRRRDGPAAWRGQGRGWGLPLAAPPPDIFWKCVFRFLKSPFNQRKKLKTSFSLFELGVREAIRKWNLNLSLSLKL